MSRFSSLALRQGKYFVTSTHTHTQTHTHTHTNTHTYTHTHTHTHTHRQTHTHTHTQTPCTASREYAASVLPKKSLYEDIIFSEAGYLCIYQNIMETHNCLLTTFR